MTNSQHVRGVTSTQYSLKRERFFSPVASTTWRPLNTVLNKPKWEHSLSWAPSWRNTA